MTPERAHANRTTHGKPEGDQGTPPVGPEDQGLRARLAHKVARRARWSFLVGRAWEDELRARMAVASYHRQMRAQELLQGGVVNAKEYRREVLEGAWDAAESAMETDRRRRRVLMRDYVSLKRTHIKAQDGQEQPVYAAMASRYWVGERGASDLIAASGFLYHPVLKDDQQEVLEDVRRRFSEAVSEQLLKKYGLEVAPSAVAPRIESLVIWDVDETTVDRIRHYEQGWGVRPKGLDKPVSELTGRDLSRIMAMHGHKVAPHRGTPLLDQHGRPLVRAEGEGDG